jgi:hypothetical protein
MNPIMKRILTSLCLVYTAVALTGCIVVGVERTTPQPLMVPTTSADSVTFAEIDAATKLTFENSRVEALVPIAGRTSLSAASQVYLVNATFKHLSFENNKVTVLNALVANKAFCNPAKQTMLTNLDKLSFDNNRAAVLASINQRGELKE